MSDDTTPINPNVTEALENGTYENPPTLAEVGEALKADFDDTIGKLGARKITKGIAQFIVGASVGFTTKKIIENNVEVEKKREKAEVYVGSAAMAAAASHASRGYLDNYIDAVFNVIERAKKTWNETQTK